MRANKRGRCGKWVACCSYKLCLEISEKLAARDPENAQWKTDIVISLWKLASILEQQEATQKQNTVKYSELDKTSRYP